MEVVEIYFEGETENEIKYILHEFEESLEKSGRAIVAEEPIVRIKTEVIGRKFKVENIKEV